MTQDHQDHIVLPGFKEGNVRAFQEVFEEFFPSLCYFAERLISDREEAEDIVLEVFTRLWQRKEHFETKANIKAFLYISTRNTCLNFLKYRERKEASSKEWQYLSEADAPTGYDYELINALVMQTVHEQVKALPPQCREVFKLIYFDNLTSAEVAARLGITTKTVLNQKLKAIRLIRTELLRQKLFMIAVLFQWWVSSRS
jgi:RNA polymerase sigma-70 factor (ECF subfamily)